MAGDLIAFLNARLDEGEAAAQKLMRGAQDAQLALKEPRLLGREIPEWWRWPDVEAMAARVLREAEADRKLIAAHEDEPEFSDPWIGLDLAVRIRASRFSDHPDYLDEWKPS